MKTNTLLSIILFAYAVTAIGQEKYITKTGELTFEASVPSFEEVRAKNTNVSAVLEAETGNFAVLALMKGFRFKVALMEEHFNENYIESSQYPKTTFKGTIKDFDFSRLSEKSEYTILGTITLHGVEQQVEIPATISIADGTLLLAAQFVLRPEQFNIKIPSIVSKKIAEDVNVAAVFKLQKQK
ncbi:YceI family protein [Marixanthomonas spongiae]|uniref:Lipid/polyisoprenoid-binding YceI-like domain-containing protein n=1 Tax=Marixanthomonas spongiae TaxID=2174845 RepID=A0A2U0I5W3_9FLAO|nr:YceI family protein [Marixanthomonas spongiae]PVW16482.1 hypothetical protein DDV96_04300 [Marixanthomonas spongiae]